MLGGLAFADRVRRARSSCWRWCRACLKALPKSGGWLDSVKVVMGFLELAAALKFFRTAELGVFSPTAVLHLRPGAGRVGGDQPSRAGCTC